MGIRWPTTSYSYMPTEYDSVLFMLYRLCSHNLHPEFFNFLWSLIDCLHDFVLSWNDKICFGIFHFRTRSGWTKTFIIYTHQRRIIGKQKMFHFPWIFGINVKSNFLTFPTIVYNSRMNLPRQWKRIENFQAPELNWEFKFWLKGATNTFVVGFHLLSTSVRIVRLDKFSVIIHQVLQWETIFSGV